MKKDLFAWLDVSEALPVVEGDYSVMLDDGETAESRWCVRAFRSTSKWAKWFASDYWSIEVYGGRKVVGWRPPARASINKAGSDVSA